MAAFAGTTSLPCNMLLSPCSYRDLTSRVHTRHHSYAHQTALFEEVNAVGVSNATDRFRQAWTAIEMLTIDLLVNNQSVTWPMKSRQQLITQGLRIRLPVVSLLLCLWARELTWITYINIQLYKCTVQYVKNITRVSHYGKARLQNDSM